MVVFVGFKSEIKSQKYWCGGHPLAPPDGNSKTDSFKILIYDHKN